VLSELSTIELSMCGDNTACCQISLTTCCIHVSEIGGRLADWLDFIVKVTLFSAWLTARWVSTFMLVKYLAFNEPSRWTWPDHLCVHWHNKYW